MWLITKNIVAIVTILCQVKFFTAKIFCSKVVVLYFPKLSFYLFSRSQTFKLFLILLFFSGLQELDVFLNFCSVCPPSVWSHQWPMLQGTNVLDSCHYVTHGIIVNFLRIHYNIVTTLSSITYYWWLSTQNLSFPCKLLNI